MLCVDRLDFLMVDFLNDSRIARCTDEMRQTFSGAFQSGECSTGNAFLKALRRMRLHLPCRFKCRCIVRVCMLVFWSWQSLLVRVVTSSLLSERVFWGSFCATFCREYHSKSQDEAETKDFSFRNLDSYVRLGFRG